MKTKPCKYCGTPVTGPFYGYPTICDSDECNEEDRQAAIEQEEQAYFDAVDDGFARYM